MFEHLGHLPQYRSRKKHWRQHFVLAFFISLGIFFFTIITVSGPSSLAVDNTPKVNLQSGSQEQRVSVGSSNIQLFTLNIDTPVSGVALRKFKIYVNGLYDPSYLSRLKIFHQGVQLGSIIDFNEQGYLLFDLGDYKLPAGSSQLLVSLPDSKGVALDTVLQFSLESRKDIELFYNQEKLIPTGRFPLVGGVTQVVSQGDWQVYNRSPKSEFISASSGRIFLGALAFSSGAEVLDIQSLDFVIERNQAKKSTSLEFFLLHQGELVARAFDQDGLIVFDLEKPLATKTGSLLDLEIYAQDLPEGDYLLSLKNLVGKGYVSNQIIAWSGPMILSRVHTADHYPIFESAKIDKTLQSSWNNVFSARVKSNSSSNLNFYKLTWYYQVKNATVRAAKVFVDSKYYPMDVIIKDNQIIAKAEWDNPLPVGLAGRQIQLLVDVNAVGAGSSVEVYLQPDLAKIEAENIWQSNIVWSADEKLQSSYLLPNLPLAPSILTNID